MSYKLVITEKPSVAQSIAKVIGADKRGDGYLEGNGYLVSWCVGHLVELAPPEAYDEKYEKWRYSDLPILPSEWKYQISDATRKQFGILKKLMEREDVTGLVEATDAGREGELIFRLVYHQAKCKKPFERLWISSMEDQAISDGFSNLQNGKKYDDLYRAALCRERADLERWNECNQIIFNFVWTDIECGKSHDADTCHDCSEGGRDRKLQARADLQTFHQLWRNYRGIGSF